MRFGVSLLSLRPGRVGGAETYLRELVAHLPAEAGQDRIVLIGHPEALKALPVEGVERATVRRQDATLVAERLLEAFTAWRARAIEQVVADLHLDAILFPQQSIFPKEAPVRAVLTVHDLQHLTHPEHLTVFDRAFRAGIYGSSLRRATRVIAISEFTQRELLSRCGGELSRVTVVPHGMRPSPLVPVTPWRGAGAPYLLYPAATWPHKDHQTLFRTYAALRRSGRLVEKLVLTGRQTSHWKPLVRLARALGIGTDVLHLGFLRADEVESVLAGARALVLPSRHEGFGLPVLEAARLGIPVITSRLTVFDELGVPPERQIDFADPEQLESALALGGPAPLCREPATWSDVARRTIEALRAAVNGPGENGFRCRTAVEPAQAELRKPSR